MQPEQQKQIQFMEDISNKYDITSFEDDSFASECLEAFDESVSRIEKEYAVTSKSA